MSPIWLSPQPAPGLNRGRPLGRSPGAALIYGDGAITPAIFVLHAAGIFCQSPSAARSAAVRRGYFRIRGGTRAQSQLGAAIAALGYCKFVTGSIEEAIPAQERARSNCGRLDACGGRPLGGECAVDLIDRAAARLS
jgi:hypothetical protein